jgi:hypothetical protein
MAMVEPLAMAMSNWAIAAAKSAFFQRTRPSV